MSDPAGDAGVGLAILIVCLGLFYALWPLLNIAFLSGIRSELKAMNRRLDARAAPRRPAPSAGRASSRAAGSHPQPHCSEPPPAAPRRSEQ